MCSYLGKKGKKYLFEPPPPSPHLPRPNPLGPRSEGTDDPLPNVWFPGLDPSLRRRQAPGGSPRPLTLVSLPLYKRKAQLCTGSGTFP